jgi:translation initiation factor IF-1
LRNRLPGLFVGKSVDYQRPTLYAAITSNRQGKNFMSKEEVLEFEGVVTEVLPDSRFRVKLENDHEIIAYTAGKMKKFRIRTIAGDRVTVEMTPYDLDKGRITFRHKDSKGAPPPGGGNQGRRPGGSGRR